MRTGAQESWGVVIEQVGLDGPLLRRLVRALGQPVRAWTEGSSQIGRVVFLASAEWADVLSAEDYPVVVGSTSSLGRWGAWDPSSGRSGLARVLARAEGVLEERRAHAGLRSMLDERLRQHEVASRHFAEMFHGLPVPCFTLDQEGTIFEWNREAEKTYGIPGHQAVQRHACELFGEGWGWLASHSGGDSAPPCFDWVYERADGVSVHLESHVIRLQGVSPEAQASICASIDVSERVRSADRIQALAISLEQERVALEVANGRLSRMATTDGLTGLWNQRQFRARLVQAAEAAETTGKPLSLLMIDIDHFKSLNDQFGHPAGDKVLTDFARVLRRHETISVLPCRYGGEEFVVILTDCGEDNAERIAERMRVQVVETPWEHRRITASFGVAEYDLADGIEGLIERADQALYAAKTSGRNRCCRYSRDCQRRAA